MKRTWSDAVIPHNIVYGVVSAAMSLFLLFLAWERAHAHKNDRAAAIAAVLVAVLGVALGLAALEWICAGL